MRFGNALGVVASLLVMACAGLVPPAALARNVVVVENVRMEMKWCSLSPAREVECELEVTSRFQDRRAGLAYPKLQDQRGQEYRMQSELMKLMVADQPYIVRLRASNLSTAATEVRSIVGSLVAKTPDGVHRIAEKVVTFSDIPARPPEPARLPTGAAPTASNAESTPAQPPEASSIPPTGDLRDSYWLGTIVSVGGAPENEITRLWRRGAYLHFRGDGIAGFNWSEPASYAYLDVNRWSQDGRRFALTMSGARYTFDLDTAPHEAFLEPGGAFKMTMQPKAKAER